VIRVYIVDDELPARQRMKDLLADITDVKIVGEANNGVAALDGIQAAKPDLVLLDIEMPELDGLGVAQNLGANGPAVIFVAAYNEHALKAFDLHAVDYLVKPVSLPRLEAAIKKTRPRSRSEDSQSLHRVLETLDSHWESRRLAIRSGAKFVIVDPKRVSAIVAKDHYSALLTDGGRELLADDPIDALTERLNPNLFVKIHRGTLLNLGFLQELHREGDRKYVAVLNDAAKTRLPVSRERLNDLKDRLGL
jgi:two-component system LytT family response regulator